MEARIDSASAAISTARAYLEAQFGPFPPCETRAHHVAGDELLRQQRELKDFCLQNGVVNDEQISQIIKESQLTADHWAVSFYHDDEPGTASTAPPTMVIVYADGRVELSRA